nr:MAG TPA: hypothetical protein [Caudoviricetes sp.]
MRGVCLGRCLDFGTLLSSRGSWLAPIQGGIVLLHRPPEETLHKPRDASFAI